MGTSLAKRVALGAHVVGERPVLLAGTCHLDTLTQGLLSCQQILELLCQILQTDSLSAIQFWLLHAPPKGEDAMPSAFSDWKLWRALFSGRHSAPTRAFPRAAAPFWSPKLTFPAGLCPCFLLPLSQQRFPRPCFLEGTSA